MLNFYEFYNKTGLDNEHYRPALDQIMNEIYTNDSKIIEHILKKNPREAVEYAANVINGRWVEAEPIIMTDPWAILWYTRDVINRTNKYLCGSNPLIRWEEAEQYTLKTPHHERIEMLHHYAKMIIRGRWPEAEPFIKEDRYWWHYYCEQFNIINIFL